ncbi:MAG: hypothetical protein AB1782_01260 [Cyanobacteriota bacterium]
MYNEYNLLDSLLDRYNHDFELDHNVKLIKNWFKHYYDHIKYAFDLKDSLTDEYSKTYNLYVSNYSTISKLKYYNWLLPSTMFNSSHIEEIHKIFNSNLTEYDEKIIIDQYIAKIFTENDYNELDLLLKKAEKNPIFSKRAHISYHCLKVLKRFGKTTSAYIILPTLISQIEGFWKDYLIQNGISERILYIDSESFYDVTVNVADIDFASFLLAKIMLSCPSFDIDIFSHKQSILRGEIVNYGSIDYVIRAYMAIDFLSNINIIDKKRK